MSGVKKAGRKRTRVLKLDEVFYIDFIAKHQIADNTAHYWMKKLDIKMTYKTYHRTNRRRAVLTKAQARAILLAVGYTADKMTRLKRVANGFRGEVAA